MLNESPYSRATLMEALASVEAEAAAFFGFLSEAEFVLRVDSAWTPAQHLDHLNISVSAVARGFAMSRWLLRLRFGRARRPSRSYEQLRDDYRARLSSGGRATGRYVPPSEELPPEQRSVRQKELLARWQRVNTRLRAALERWSEEELDRIQLPHPLLGKITAREMVLFTIYHNQHHVAGAKSRLPG